MTDGPYELPSGWRWVKLGEIAAVKYGKAKPKGDGHVPVVGSGGVYSSTSKPLVENPTIVIGRKGSAGSVALFEQPCWPSDTTFFLEWSTVDLYPRFVFYALLNSPFSTDRAKTTLPTLQRQDIEGYLIPHPPLAEQHHIVARVEALMERVREAERLREQASRDTDQLMQSALGEALRELRSSYPFSTIGQLRVSGKLDIYGGGTPSKKAKAFWEGSIPWVSPKDMKRLVIDSTEDHISPEALAASSAKMIPAGAVLAVVRGMILARSWPIAVSGVDLTINQDMKALVPKAGILAEYLGYVLKGLEHQVLGQVETAAHGTRRLRTSTMESLKVPTPSLSEQHRIVTYLDSVRQQAAALKRAQEDTEAELRRLEQAILDRAFRGEL
jgi:type I restriction enzyme, S subunit